MGHANIQHPKTGMWRCWSTVVDNWITDWMTESDYKEWLIQEAANSMREELQDFGITSILPLKPRTGMQYNSPKGYTNLMGLM